jgi:hypothetical protein
MKTFVQFAGYIGFGWAVGSIGRNLDIHIIPIALIAGCVGLAWWSITNRLFDDFKD